MTELMNRSPFILRGFGWFNVFFAAEFLLAAGDWISLNLVLNALLMVWLLVPFNRPALALGRRRGLDRRLGAHLRRKLASGA